MKANYILSILLAGLVLCTFNACKKLELAPEDYFGSGNFWKNKSQVEGAMLGLHSTLRGQQFTLFTMGELRSGVFNSQTSGTGSSSLNSGNFIRQDIRESSPGLSGWAGFYADIFQINNFIYQVGQTNFLSAEDKGYYLGQAYGLRALYYFHLYRTFGRVPLATEPKVLTNTPTSSDQAYLPRAKSEKETLDFIKSDIGQSETNFNNVFTTKNQKAQWSLAATLMLKGEVYLWSAKVLTDGQNPSNTAADLSAARAALETIIPKYNLQGSFASVFNSAGVPANKGNNEIIFALRYAYPEAANAASQFVYQQADNMAGFLNAAGQPYTSDPLSIAGSSSIIRYEYKYDLFSRYDANDTRRAATFFDYYKAPTATNRFIMMTKFMGAITEGIRRFVDDIPMYRLPDAVLLLAEIKNKQGQDPSAEINRIRQRAYGNNPYPVYANGSFEQNELAILEERTKEFVFEGKRWYDLRRMQDASGSPLVFRKDLPLIGVLDKATEAYKLVLPIDRNTLNNDETLKNDQNTGYPGT
ncbi:RagB/SusD family nutrient uptake outer membrane protein [Pedobacter africanus]|uniref:Starch-binding associating with outer membrane n=1 Tax=Pedobacter africanus TaxID=151894 RepID=A0A1W2A3I6_9SPHI|nr:RagB/SusD family nutrient uptake outer membrane protein [Pedobacter africanus]SMC54991.1 Starch-binding associating with outer membrane [Pedobacter africanus]